jgi:hypothetical protein
MHEKMNTIQSNLLDKNHSQILTKILLREQALTSSPHPFIPFLIPYATHAKADLLIDAIAVHTRIAVSQ